MDTNIMDAHKSSGASTAPVGAIGPVGAIMDSFRVLVGALASASRTSELELGMTGAQHFVLQKLLEGGEMSVNELAERTHTHQSTVSTVVTKLVAKGLVHRERSESDARVQLLSLTTRGKQKLRKTSDTIQDRLIHAIEGLPASKREQLSTLLADVLHGAGLDRSRPALFFETTTRKRTRKEIA